MLVHIWLAFGFKEMLIRISESFIEGVPDFYRGAKDGEQAGQSGWEWSGNVPTELQDSECCQVASVVSDSVRPHGLQPTRLLHPWDSPGKNTGVGCHFLLQCMKVKSESEVAQSCPTLSDPKDCSLPGSSIHGIFRATVLEWGAIAFSPRLRIGPC